MSNTSRARLADVMAVVHFVPHLYEKEVMAPAPASPLAHLPRLRDGLLLHHDHRRVCQMRRWPDSLPPVGKLKKPVDVVSNLLCR